jgi:cytoskeletal protein CcmA (bactofilin family)
MTTESRERRVRDRGGESATIVAQHSVWSGELGGSADCLVFGRVQGRCRLDATVVVERSGSWQGEIEARNVVVAGAVDGDIRAHGHLELAATARIRGNIRGQTIAIAEGAVCDGEVHTDPSGGVPTYFRERRGS